ncbi:hypothetical protein FKP32DRAFT_1587332 [Trametes sanguinea]|nr:hypothetical protein FKP32DRAFT_1587332 [Trametes sanguinea]
MFVDPAGKRAHFFSFAKVSAISDCPCAPQHGCTCVTNIQGSATTVATGSECCCSQSRSSHPLASEVKVAVANIHELSIRDFASLP